jgi:hypothetical protein
MASDEMMATSVRHEDDIESLPGVTLGRASDQDRLLKPANFAGGGEMVVVGAALAYTTID